MLKIISNQRPCIFNLSLIKIPLSEWRLPFKVNYKKRLTANELESQSCMKYFHEELNLQPPLVKQPQAIKANRSMILISNSLCSRKLNKHFLVFLFYFEAKGAINQYHILFVWTSYNTFVDFLIWQPTKCNSDNKASS